jgi:hypothetical protein
LDIFWLRDESLEEFENQPGPEVDAQDRVGDIGGAMDRLESIAGELENPVDPTRSVFSI